MGLADAFSSEERIPMRFSEFYELVKTTAKGELLINAVNADVPHEYIRSMITGINEFKQSIDTKYSCEPEQPIGE